jgi:hypothetical protein
MSSDVGWINLDASRAKHSRVRTKWGVFLAALTTALLLLPATAFAEFNETDPTTLCKEAVSKCEAAQRYPSGTTIEASLKSGTQFKLNAGFVTMECAGSTLSGKTTAEYGAPLSLEVSTLSLSTCKGCTSPEFQNLPYSASAEQSTANNATVSVKSSGKGTPTAKLSGCPFGTVCKYGASALGTLEGGNPATLVAKEAPLELQEGSGGLCAKVGKLTATYEITAPKPLYASRMPETTLLCKEFANPCPAASVLPKGTSFEGTSGEIGFTFSPLWGTLFCTESTMSAVTNAETGNPLPAEITSMAPLVGCSGCKSFKFTNLPYKTSIEPTTGGDGKMTVYAKLEFSGCPLGTTCTYEGTMPLELDGGEFPGVITKEIEFKRGLGSGGNCSEKMTMTGTRWASTTKNPIWVARMKA